MDVIGHVIAVALCILLLGIPGVEEGVFPGKRE